MLTFFDNRRIATKIGIGSGILVAILCGVSILSFTAFRTIGNADAEVGRLSRVADAGATLDRSFLNLRLHAREFAHTGNPAEMAQIEAARRELSASIADATAVVVNPGAAVLLGDVKAGADRYVRQFETLLGRQAELATLMSETLDPLSDEVQEDLISLGAARRSAGDAAAASLLEAGLRQALTLRRTADKALGGRDPEIYAAAAAASEDLLGTIKKLEAASADGDVRAAFSELKEDLELYRGGFEKALALHVEADTLLMKDLPAIAKTVAESARELRDEAKAEQDEFRRLAELTASGSEAMVTGASLGGVLVGLLLSWLIGARIAKPVSKMRDAMRLLAGGDRSVLIPAIGRKDEIGEMAEAVDVFKANLVENERMRLEQEALKAKSEKDRRSEMLQLANQFELAVGGIIQTVSSSSSQLQSTASTMSASAQQMTGQAQTVSGASEEAAANVQTVATAAEELASSVAEIGRQVTESARVAGEAARDAEGTVAKVRELSSAAQKIGDVVDLINNIAAQTNLLALNATIEAARAGEAGKGFAVVAAEVKQLADQTAKATSEIAAQIQGIQVSTADSVGAITSIAEVIGRINGIASTIASAVEEQGAATQEIARNVQLAAQGTSMVTENIGGVSIASSDVSSAAGQVLSAAGDLNRQSQSLRTEVNRFLDTVRAA